ncbi:hypothetical protein W02_41090 [Nitrospira sp. KM1]|uniref:hypothetical protein n=1 Tax=Nitrospira sp. KM1 TaxID=1936990 RepID=UPI0013A7B389|nr:hypothetical protein [Nitrospira sp. KM1]BCA56969.1 hypothetical protein W02_41090 [Nitrospira sp. KM1]
MPDLITATDDQRRFILAAMRHVAIAGGRFQLSAPSARSLRSAAQHMFQQSEQLDLSKLPEVSPREVASLLSSRDQAEMTVRFLAVTALVDGELNRARIEAVLAFADALGIRADYVTHLQRSIEGDLQWALNDMSRQNILSLWNEPWDESIDINDVFLPYKGGNADPVLAARYHALERLPSGTVGRAFSEIYRANGYAFPGEEKAVNVRFATPHDATHVVSGYDTSPRGEILVSTFTAGMHAVRPMEGHILPVLYSWHLNIKINDLAGAASGQLDPVGFWEAWARGARAKVDLFSPAWDFWAVAGEPVESARSFYGVIPLSKVH